MIISLVTTLIAITVASPAAYGIVRFFKKLGSAMSKVLVTTYIFPPILPGDSLFRRDGEKWD